MIHQAAMAIASGQCSTVLCVAGQNLLSHGSRAKAVKSMAEGGSAWREHGVTASRVEARNRPHIEPAIPTLWQLAASQLQQVVANGTLPAD